MGEHTIDIPALYRRAVTLKQAGRLREAEQLLNTVLQYAPLDSMVLLHLGAIAAATGRIRLATTFLQQSIHANPVNTDALSALGEIHRKAGRIEDALACFDKAIALNPQLVSAYNNRGLAYIAAGRPSKAIESWRTAIGIAETNPGPPATLDTTAPGKSQHHNRPDLRQLPLSHNNIGNARLEQGRTADAISEHRRACELAPDSPVFHSNLLRDFLHTTAITPEDLLKQSHEWWVHHAPQNQRLPHSNSTEPDRPLRVGFISPDFRKHAIAYFLRALFEHHDRTAFAFVGYANVTRPDELTRWFQERSAGWRNIAGISDDRAAEIIQKDAVDILIDVTGHGAETRLRIFAAQPAPVQIAYVGYPATTGSPFLGWRITDAWADPPGMTDSHFSEKLWRLPRSAWCYWPPNASPDTATPDEIPPVLRNAHAGSPVFTFGSFNNLSKLSDQTLGLWAAILRSVPQSRLFLKAKMLRDASVCSDLRARFCSQGIDAERLTLSGWERKMDAHFSRYREVDLALDTFPYHGTTTTCDALLMNVPVVTLEGRTHLSRVGVSLLNAVGLSNLIAHADEEYVAIAVRLAQNVDELANIRKGLHNRMKQSPLMDGPTITTEFSAALRGMWRQWCADGSPDLQSTAMQMQQDRKEACA